MDETVAPEDQARIRPARDDDADGVIRLIEAVFAEYPGNVLDVDGEEPGLRRPASSHDGFWVLDVGGEIRGCSAWMLRTSDDGRAVGELKKIYLARSMRGRGFGRRLIEAAENAAAAAGVRAWIAWSDTRFETAHHVYEAMGYRATGRRRELHDLSNSTEVEFRKDRTG